MFDTKEGLVSPSKAAEEREENKKEKTEEKTKEAVCFDHVCLTYKNGGAEALTDIDFKVQKGQTVGIIGGTGSGKSSIVHLIPRFYDAVGGSIRINGIDVREYPLEELRAKIGMVMQKAVLFKGTVRENLLWGKEDATEEEMWHALEVSQAKEFVEAKEGGLDAGIAQGGKNLSGGQKQRLSIARAIARKPEIFIFDDSFSALDYKTDRKLREALDRECRAATRLIVAQRIGTIRDADKIIVLEEGKIAGIGSHNELMQNCEVYKQIAFSQLSKEELA